MKLRQNMTNIQTKVNNIYSNITEEMNPKKLVSIKGQVKVYSVITQG